MSKPTVFISYSRRDEAWKGRLVTHLGVARKRGVLDLGDDQRIGAGEDWDAEIERAMAAAGIAIRLVSADSLTSDFILRTEMRRLLERRDEEGLRVFPLIIRPCDWKAVEWPSRVQVHPKSSAHITSARR